MKVFQIVQESLLPEAAATKPLEDDLNLQDESDGLALPCPLALPIVSALFNCEKKNKQ